MKNADQTVQKILNIELLKSIFASFPELRYVKILDASGKETGRNYDKAVARLKENTTFASAIIAEADMSAFKEMTLTAFDSAVTTLRERFSEAMDKAIQESKPEDYLFIKLNNY